MDDATDQSSLELLHHVGDRTAGLGPLLLEYGSADALIDAADERLAELPAATQQALAEFRRARSAASTEKSRRGSLRLAGEHGSDSFLPIFDPRYPSALRAAPDAPPWLFCRGDVSSLRRPAIAIVGSRRASRAGLHAAEKLGRDLAASGYVICSGLALGVDAAAHRGALRRGETLAVLASGLDRPSPRQHEHLARQVAAAGCLLSELPYGTAPHRGRFPRRNRIISGLCQATIVVEAALPSGSLHTAAAALDQGRDVYVIPWSPFHSGGSGCLRLLRDGATPITDLDELADLFPPVAPGTPAVGTRDNAANASSATAASDRAKGAALSDEEQRLLQLVGDASLGPEELSACSGIGPVRLFPMLASLELRGALLRIDGRYQRALR
ncbi:MAG: DNA-processing protein DprA [Halieaceae bacterium]|jgi:DNA processing protein|nr:DNA-processing protein DprA [Halieaceae bacterium]